ncbi:hypothetical protein HDZ31DRAFT_71932 [Schizophyllum fasciatum]
MDPNHRNRVLQVATTLHAILRRGRPPNLESTTSSEDLSAHTTTTFDPISYESRRRELLGRRNRLLGLVQQQHALIAPIHALPVELLTEVILFTCLSGPMGECNRMRSAVSAVSRHWRAVALSTPRLWAKIEIFAVLPPSPPWKAGVRTCLERSGRSALDILYNCNPGPPSRPLVNVAAAVVGSAYWDPNIWGLLCAQAHRWRSAVLCALPTDAFTARPAPSFPRLVSLSYAVAPGRAEFFADAPALACLPRVNCFEREPFVFPSRWNVTVLRLVLQPGHTMQLIGMSVDALASCSATLTHLHVCIERSATVEYDIRPDTVALPRLRTLHLKGMAFMLGGYVSTPALEQLHVEKAESQRAVFARMASLLEHSGNCPALRVAALRGVSLKDPAMLTGLARSPFLTELHIVVHGAPSFGEDPARAALTHELVARMTRSGEGEAAAFLPRLRCLTMTFKRSEVFPSERLRAAMRRMLRSREAGSSGTPRVVFSTNCGGRWL